MIEHQIAQGLHEQAPLLSFRYGRPNFPDERLGHFPALAQLRGHLVDPLFLASERGAGNGINAHTPQMFEEFVKRQPALGKYPVYLLQNLRRQSAKG